MKTKKYTYHDIPILLWGKDSGKLIVAVHGMQSCKSDHCIRILAEEAVPLGYQVLSFDLPNHGERMVRETTCLVRDCVNELSALLRKVRKQADEISLFGCSLGAYFSLLACQNETIRQAWFLSPIVDIKQLLDGMMQQAGVSEKQLEREKSIPTNMETLYWDYYCYVKNHPIAVWTHPTSILCGEYDAVSPTKTVSAFAEQYHCGLTVQPGGEHWFHTPEQLGYYRAWVKSRIS